MSVPQRRSGWPRVHLAMGFVVAVALYLAADDTPLLRSRPS